MRNNDIAKQVNKWKNNSKRRTEDFYLSFIRFKDVPRKIEAFELLKEMASIKNKNLKTRFKALATISFLQDVCCDKNVSEFYRDGNVLCNNRQDIERIIDENCKEMLTMVKNKTLKSDNIYKIIHEIFSCIISFELKDDVIIKLIRTVYYKFDLKNKVEAKIATHNEDFIYSVIKTNFTKYL